MRLTIAWLERALAGEGLRVVTTADAAVLDAMAAVPDGVLVWAPRHAVSSSLDEACRAEIARREARR